MLLLDLTPLRRYRDYRLLYSGQFASFIGTQLSYVALPYQVYQLTHSSLAVGMIGMAQLVPLVVFGLIGGVFADSQDRRRLLIAAELCMVLLCAMLFANASRATPALNALCTPNWSQRLGDGLAAMNQTGVAPSAASFFAMNSANRASVSSVLLPPARSFSPA